MTISRRQFLEAGAAGAVLLLGCRRRGAKREAVEPDLWIRIEASGRVTVICDKSEMGQGASTALSLIVADELGVPWSAVAVEHAHPGSNYQDMGTSGSSSVSDRWRVLRTAAAAAREMLIGAAAEGWSVPAEECSLEDGRVVHGVSKRATPIGDLVGAAARRPIPSDPPLRPRSAFRLIGTRVPRLDLHVAVTGAKQYGADLRLPGQLFATIARCPVPGGKVSKWDGSRAKNVPGVRHVVEVSSGIAVVATNTWSALEGRRALDITWDDGPGRSVDSTGIWHQLDQAFAGAKQARRGGDPDRAFQAAARTLEAEYQYPFQSHAAVEPVNALARVDVDGCEIWVGTQAPNWVQDRAASVLRIRPSRVTVNVLPLGGAFGRRIHSDFAIEAVEVARAVKAPVHLQWTREDDFGWDLFQSAALIRMRAGLDAEGRISAWSHRISDFNLSSYGAFDAKAFDPAAANQPWGGIDTPYRFAAMDIRMGRLEAPVRTGAWRSVFYPSSVLARECFLDEVAVATGTDPVTLRTVLLDGDSVAGGKPRLKRVVELAAEAAGWSRPLAPIAGRKVGRGIACNFYDGATVIATVAEVSVGSGDDIRVERLVVAIDCGTAVDLGGVEAQVEGGAAWSLSTLFGREITFAGGRAQQLTYGDYPVLPIGAMPRVEVHVVPSELPPMGAGEQPVPTVMPAVLNALCNATGRRVRRVPLTAAATP